VPYSTCDPYLEFVPSFVPILVSSLDGDSEDENPPPHPYLPPCDFIEIEPTSTPPLPRWVYST
jgi:hypothetical protein